MPGRDGTGPKGTGPMGGRRFGNCADRGAALGAQAAPGQGLGRCFGQGGGGRGKRHGAMQGGRRFGFDASNRDSAFSMENQSLKIHNEALQSELDAIKKRLDDMETLTADSR